MSKTQAALKRILVGRPMSSGELEHTLLPKVIALPVFASDPLSSNAYATQEAMIVLITAGAAGLNLILPVSVAVACVLAVVVNSYRQTVKAYPQGGGAYRVSAENLGMYPGLLAASALLGDYVLTVAVSVTAGTDAILSAAPSLEHYRVAIAVGFIVLVTLANLRGAKESGTLFAIPTYGFVTTIFVMLIVGFIRCLGGCPQAESADIALHVIEPLSFFLVLKAFAAGTTALTGVEAIADGTAAFRYPQSKNASTTLAVMGALTITMFLGISILADATNVHHTEEATKTVLAEIGHAVFGGGFLFYFLQVMTMAILVLAANTAYQDFPRLSSILAADKFMPRQFMSRGDRLVFSNGVMILSVLAAMLVVAFDAELNHLIQLYLIGVFISFTLSQTGLTRKFRREKEPGWQKRAAVSAFGAVVTGIVLVVIGVTKFKGGAWIIMASIPVLVYMMRSIHKHYMDVSAQLEHPDRAPLGSRAGDQHVTILVRKVDAATVRAVGYVRSLRATNATAVCFDPHEVAGAWVRVAPDIPLETLPPGGSKPKRIRAYLANKRAAAPRNAFVTAVVPEVLATRSIFEIFKHPGIHRLKAGLLRLEGVQVMDVPVVQDEIVAGVDQAHEPVRNIACILVSGVHNSTLQAIEYAETLRPTDIRAVSFGLEPEESERLGDEWLEERIPYPLEIEASPFRDIGTSLKHYLRALNADGVERVVTVIIPEFVVKKRRHQVLHGQTALVVKRYLLFETGIVTASVPFHLQD